MKGSIGSETNAMTTGRIKRIKTCACQKRNTATGRGRLMTQKNGILRRQPADPSHKTTTEATIGSMARTLQRSRILVCVNTAVRSLEENVIGHGLKMKRLKITPKECTAATFLIDFDS